LNPRIKNNANKDINNPRVGILDTAGAIVFKYQEFSE